MIAAALVLIAALTLASLTRSLCVDFYRPWLERRWQAELADWLEFRAWMKEMRK